MKRFSYVLTSDNAENSKQIGTLAQEASHFSSRLSVQCGKGVAALGELKELLNLGLHRGKRVTVTAEGNDEEAAIAAILRYFVAYL